LTVHVLAPPPVGGKAEPIAMPTTIPTSIWIGLALVVIPLAATVAFVKLKKKRKQ